MIGGLPKASEGLSDGLGTGEKDGLRSEAMRMDYRGVGIDQVDLLVGITVCVYDGWEAC